MPGDVRPPGPDGPPADVVVLKFGSSLLDGADGYRTAVEEIGRDVARRRRVLVVVSAGRGVTDSLLHTARAVMGRGDGAADASLVARLLRTGEEASVSLLGLAARGVGLRTGVLGADDLDLRTSGPVDDAEPVDVDVEALGGALTRNDVAIVPGFVGRNRRGCPTVLGRGGSDYTALYLGSRMGATEIRLLKDVDGVFPGDPREPWTRPLTSASWLEVERLGGGVVQSKALRFAEREGLGFRIAAPGGRGTRVGDGP